MYGYEEGNEITSLEDAIDVAMYDALDFEDDIYLEDESDLMNMGYDEND